ncbi:MAG: hypothetical protein ACXABY_00550 [Candidatus Thorarchaeota archaeon]|jgi:hypothetical protein
MVIGDMLTGVVALALLACMSFLVGLIISLAKRNSQRNFIRGIRWWFIEKLAGNDCIALNVEQCSGDDGLLKVGPGRSVFVKSTLGILETGV